jgi:hypothetical protein
MSDSAKKVTDEIEQITHTMQLVARRINAQFEIDPRRAEDFATAVTNRRKRKERSQLPVFESAVQR